MAFRFILESLAGIIAILLLVKFLSIKKTKKNSSNEPPEPPFTLPILGHLHLLARAAQPYKTLAAMAGKYGAAFGLRLGVRRTLVVSSSELAKECFTSNDRVFATRPQLLTGEQLGYNCAIFGLAPYGPYRREIRRIVILELFSSRRIELHKHARALEVGKSVRELFERWTENGRNPVRVDMKQSFNNLTFNILLQMIAGKRYFGNSVSEDDEEVARRFQALAKEARLHFERDGVSDALPFLGWIDLKGHRQAAKRVSMKIDSIVEGWIAEHHREKDSAEGDESRKDFIDLLLSTAKDGRLPTLYDADTTIKATVRNLIQAGVDSTAETLIWALALLLNNHHVLEKAQAELDIHVGKERIVDESDIRNLVYIQAITKETMRLYPIAPLLLPHEAIEDCLLGGYHIPCGTRLLVNVWKIHRDPHVWSCPEEFRPERFLESHVDVDVRGQHFELIPFGSGRRSCPGMSLALRSMHLILARMLQGFEWDIPKDEGFDMEEEIGFFICKQTPLKVLVIPRLPSWLY